MDVTFNSMFSLLAVVYLLGLKHGMDPDHLLVIDGLSRTNSECRPRLARWAGLLFSFGHGLVVVAASLLVSFVANEWQIPGWLEYSGALISICFLFALGGINFMAAFQTTPDGVVPMRGLKSRWVKHFVKGEHPALIVGIGALFALSFDTVTHAMLFGTAASNLMQWQGAFLVGTVFMLGMMTTDTLNGIWIFHLLKRANRHAQMVSRVLCLTIAGISITIGSIALLRLFFSSLQEVVEQWWSYSGILIMLFILFSFYIARGRAAALSKF
jgi:high-affinity nickel-transport protein